MISRALKREIVRSLRMKRVRNFFFSGGNRRAVFYPNFESSYLLNGLTD